MPVDSSILQPQFQKVKPDGTGAVFFGTEINIKRAPESLILLWKDLNLYIFGTEYITTKQT